MPKLSEADSSIPLLQRKIIHVDMDAFFAAVEQRDRPELHGLPVIVGGDPEGRGVVATCSYEARSFGIHSAMSSARARTLCPEAVFLRPRMDAYREVSLQIMAILRRVTPLVEPLSLDEAFLDVTAATLDGTLATDLARSIRAEIFHETGLTASAGVSYNKLLAKLASDWRKPNGLCVIPPERGLDFLSPLLVKKLHGIGPATARKLSELGVETVADLRRLSLEVLLERFGKAGRAYFGIARGEDPRPVCPDRERKSVGRERTFSEDIADPENMRQVLMDMAERVAARLQGLGVAGRSITIKVRFPDFTTITRTHSVARPVWRAEDIQAVLPALCDSALPAGAPQHKTVRLLGLSVSQFSKLHAVEKGDGQQLDLL